MVAPHTAAAHHYCLPFTFLPYFFSPPSFHIIVPFHQTPPYRPLPVLHCVSFMSLPYTSSENIASRAGNLAVAGISIHASPGLPNLTAVASVATPKDLGKNVLSLISSCPHTSFPLTSQCLPLPFLPSQTFDSSPLRTEHFIHLPFLQTFLTFLLHGSCHHLPYSSYFQIHFTLHCLHLPLAPDATLLLAFLLFQLVALRFPPSRKSCHFRLDCFSVQAKPCQIGLAVAEP